MRPYRAPSLSYAKQLVPLNLGLSNAHIRISLAMHKFVNEVAQHTRRVAIGFVRYLSESQRGVWVNLRFQLVHELAHGVAEPCPGKRRRGVVIVCHVDAVIWVSGESGLCELARAFEKVNFKILEVLGAGGEYVGIAKVLATVSGAVRHRADIAPGDLREGFDVVVHLLSLYGGLGGVASRDKMRVLTHAT